MYNINDSVVQDITGRGKLATPLYHNLLVPIIWYSFKKFPLQCHFSPEGFDDIKNRLIITTSLPPLSSILKDPLIILRSIHFGMFYILLYYLL